MRHAEPTPLSTPAPQVSRSGDGPRRRIIGGVAAAALACLTLAACSNDGRSIRAPSADQNLSIITTTTPAADSSAPLESSGTVLPLESTTAFATAPTTSTTVAGVIDSGPVTGFTVTTPWPEGGVIDAAYTCTGADTAPTLQWSNVPPDAAELAIVVVDPDAENFVHWVVAGISPGVTALDPAALPAGTVQGLNGFGTLGWRGPCPPAGESHTYRFEVHTLSNPSGLSEGTVGDGMLRVIDANTLEVAVAIGVFPGS